MFDRNVAEWRNSRRLVIVIGWWYFFSRAKVLAIWFYGLCQVSPPSCFRLFPSVTQGKGCFTYAPLMEAQRIRQRPNQSDSWWPLHVARRCRRQETTRRRGPRERTQSTAKKRLFSRFGTARKHNALASCEKIELQCLQCPHRSWAGLQARSASLSTGGLRRQQRRAVIALHLAIFTMPSSDGSWSAQIVSRVAHKCSPVEGDMVQDAVQTSSGYPDPLQVLSCVCAAILSWTATWVCMLSFSPCRCSCGAFSRIHC